MNRADVDNVCCRRRVYTSPTARRMSNSVQIKTSENIKKNFGNNILNTGTRWHTSCNSISCRTL